MDSPITSKMANLTVAASDSVDRPVKPMKTVTLNGNCSAIPPGPSDSSVCDKPNPWKTRQPSSTISTALSIETESAVEPTEAKPEPKLEPSAWPEPSATTERRASSSVTMATKHVDDKPKNRKPARKWQNVEIEFSSSRGGRGSSRISPVVSQTVPSTQTSGYLQSSRGGQRRGGLNGNAPNGRGRGARTNGHYAYQQQPQRPSFDSKRTADTYGETTSTHMNDAAVGQPSEPGTSRPTNTATVYAGRGGYSNRPRRPGGPWTAYNGGSSVGLNKGPPSNAPAVLQATNNPQGLAVPPVTYVFPDGATALLSPAATRPGFLPPNEMAVLDGSALQGAVLLSNFSTQTPALVSPEPSPAISAPLSEVVSVEQMLEFISAYGWTQTSVPDMLCSIPAVNAAMKAMGVDFASASGDSVAHGSDSGTATPNAPSPGVKKNDVISVDNEVFFVPRNAHLTKFLKLKSKDEYIRHHVDYYFSEINLQRDYHLRTILSENNQVCPLANLLMFNRLRWANCTEEELLHAVQNSPTVSVVYGLNQQSLGVAPTASSMVHVSTGYNGHVSPPRPEVPGVATMPTAAPTTTVQSAFLNHNMPIMHARTPIAGLHNNPTAPCNPFFPPHQLLPYAGIPNPFHSSSHPPYFIGTSSAASTQPSGGAGDQAALLESNAMYYRALLAAASVYPPVAAPPPPQYSQTMFYQYLPQAASGNNPLVRNAVAATLFNHTVSHNPGVQQQKVLTVSVRVPSNSRPVSAEVPSTSQNTPNEGDIA